MDWYVLSPAWRRAARWGERTERGRENNHFMECCWFDWSEFSFLLTYCLYSDEEEMRGGWRKVKKEPWLGRKVKGKVGAVYWWEEKAMKQTSLHTHWVTNCHWQFKYSGVPVISRVFFYLCQLYLKPDRMQCFLNCTICVLCIYICTIHIWKHCDNKPATAALHSMHSVFSFGHTAIAPTNLVKIIFWLRHCHVNSSLFSP